MVSLSSWASSFAIPVPPAGFLQALESIIWSVRHLGESTTSLRQLVARRGGRCHVLVVVRGLVPHLVCRSGLDRPRHFHGSLSTIGYGGQFCDARADSLSTAGHIASVLFLLFPFVPAPCVAAKPALCLPRPFLVWLQSFPPFLGRLTHRSSFEDEFRDHSLFRSPLEPSFAVGESAHLGMATKPKWQAMLQRLFQAPALRSRASGRRNAPDSSESGIRMSSAEVPSGYQDSQVPAAPSGQHSHHTLRCIHTQHEVSQRSPCRPSVI